MPVTSLLRRTSVAAGALRSCLMTSLSFTKHHGLGNDFLVTFDDPGDDPCGSSLACAVRPSAAVHRCGRTPPRLRTRAASDARMVLFNADGSRAEMSGNGIRCFAQAVASQRGEGDHRGPADSDRCGHPGRPGRRPTEDPTTIEASGRHGRCPPARRSRRGGRTASAVIPTGRSPISRVGNPHSVVGVDEVEVVDLLRARRHGATGEPGDRRAGPRDRCRTSRCGSTSEVWASPRPAARAPAPRRGRRGNGVSCPTSAAPVTVHMPGGSPSASRLDGATRRADGAGGVRIARIEADR